MPGPPTGGPCDVPWYPHGLRKARPYACGRRCDRHTPAAMAGRPEPQPGPGYTPQNIPTALGASGRLDDRAVASGKRRSAPHTYRAAQAAVNTRKDQHQ